MSSEKDLNPEKILKKVAWPMGIWPLSDNYFSLFRTLVIIAIQISLVTCVTIEITLGCCNPEEVIDFIELQKFGTISALKVILVRFYRENIARIISSINEDWLLTKKPKLLQIMRSYARIGNFVFYVQGISTSTVIFFQVVGNLPFLTPGVKINSTNATEEIIFERMLPQRTKCLFMDVSSTSYVLVYILQSIQLISTGLGNVGTDIFFFSLAMHLSGQLEILYEELQEFTGKDDLHLNKLRIVSFSKRHQKLLEDAQSLETTFSVIILVQLAINITGISLFGIQLIVNLRKYGILAAIKPLTAIDVLMVQLFLYCYAGELLSSKLKMITLGAYQSHWYKLPKNLAKNIYFIMLRAGKPFRLTAGQLLGMNMDTFTNIIKVSVSYFSVLRLMLET